MDKISRLKKEDYDCFLSFLNESFGYNDENGFQVQLPVMWRRTDEAMNKNYCIKDNNKIIAGMGTYPLELNVVDIKLNAATTGNVAVLKEYRNNGYMKDLMDYTDKSLRELGIDFARLGGERQRYNRYGYENVGTNYFYSLNIKNIKSGIYGKNKLEVIPLTFKKIFKKDTKEIEALKEIHGKNMCYVNRRSINDFYDIMIAWKNEAYIAYDLNGNIYGGLAVSPDLKNIAEYISNNEKEAFNLIVNWVIYNNDYADFNVPCYEKDLIKEFSMICNYQSITYSTMIKVINYENCINAFLALKNKIDNNLKYVNGTFVIEINGFGNYLISSIKCEKTKDDADFSIDNLTATRLLFGYQKPSEIINIPENKKELIDRILPLPFWWNGQDRI